MRICHVITRLIIGGAQENTILTCRGLVELGHDVTLVAGPETGPEGSLWDQASGIGCERIRVRSLRRAIRPIHDWLAFRELRRLFQHLRPDVVHTHSSKAGILGRFAAAEAGVPTIVHTLHGMSFNRTQTAAVQRFYRALEKSAARQTSAFVSVADAMTQQALAAGLGEAGRFVTIRSGVEIARFRPCGELRERCRKEWGVGDKDVVVGTIARLFKNKGYEDLIAAMPTAVSQEPRLRFVWLGGGAHRSRYEARLRALGLYDRVRFVGLVSPDEVARYLNGFDILVHASRWEGLPRAVVQALLCEVPAVSFDNDGAPEVVIPEQTGLLVRVGDTNGLANAVVRLAADAELRRRLGRGGRQWCKDRFDWRAMVRQLDALYQRLATETH